MRVGAGQLADVQRHARRVGQGLEEVFHQLRLVAADALRRELQVAAQVRTTGEVLCSGRRTLPTGGTVLEAHASVHQTRPCPTLPTAGLAALQQHLHLV